MTNTSYPDILLLTTSANDNLLTLKLIMGFLGEELSDWAAVYGELISILGETGVVKGCKEVLAGNIIDLLWDFETLLKVPT